MNQNSILNLIGRKTDLFRDDLLSAESDLRKIISSSTFLVIGAAGSIGQAVTKEIFKSNNLLFY
jgi:FlaA1/EpsC-like NDP-sugar epimerase